MGAVAKMIDGVNHRAPVAVCLGVILGRVQRFEKLAGAGSCGHSAPHRAKVRGGVKAELFVRVIKGHLVSP